MSLKKFDLAKNLGMKVAGQMKIAGVPDRFAQGAAEAADKREQRRRDAAAGLVPFACKLPVELSLKLQALAPAHAQGLNGLVAELLVRALEEPAPAAKKAASKKADTQGATAETDVAPPPARKKAVSRKP